MPYGTPEEANIRRYKLRFNSDLVEAGYSLTFECIIADEGGNDPDADQAFQDLIDFINSSPKYNVPSQWSAIRFQEFQTPVTPTP